MRCGERLLASTLALVALSAGPRAEALAPIHGQRYSMGTMFDIVVYHASTSDAGRAIEQALNEVVRLDRVMSHYDAGSELARVHRDARKQAIRVDSSLYDVVGESLDLSRRTGGKFDVTIAPLLTVWKSAESEGRRPDEAEIARARRCVGYEKIELTPPDRIHLRSDCVALDLGGIGKGYAVERALETLKQAGIRNAIVNAGGSSIAAIGAPPGRDGWPVLLSAAVGARRVLLLRNTSLSTSQQDPQRAVGDIIDPLQGRPIVSRSAAVVVSRSATLADALSTAMVVLTVDEGMRLLAEFGDVSALWISPGGEVSATYGLSRLALADTH